MQHPFAKATALLAAAALAPALASANTLLDFEGVTSFASIAAFYDGGTDSDGATGPDFHVVFGGDALGLKNDAAGPYFSNAPTPMGVMVPVGPSAVMNAADGFWFTGSVGFFYSADAAVSGGVQVWSGANATGTLLASANLMANAQAGGCSDSPYCNFSSASLPFAGQALSVSFAATTGAGGFDNVSVTVVPEPATVLLMSLGVVGLLAARRRG